MHEGESQSAAYIITNAMVSVLPLLFRVNDGGVHALSVNSDLLPFKRIGSLHAERLASAVEADAERLAPSKGFGGYRGLGLVCDSDVAIQRSLVRAAL